VRARPGPLTEPTSPLVHQCVRACRVRVRACEGQLCSRWGRADAPAAVGWA